MKLLLTHVPLARRTYYGARALARTCATLIPSARHRWQLLALVMVGFVSQASAQATTWTIDPAHSSIIFSLRHAVTPFIGNFKTFSGSLTWDAAHLDKSSVNACCARGASRSPS